MTDGVPSCELDPVMVRVGEGIALCECGDRDAARRLFDHLWHEIGGDAGDALHRCAIAHSMADARDNVHEELAWDLLALVAADVLTDARLADSGAHVAVATLYPSLHLNLAECYRKLGDEGSARHHLQQARVALSALPDDGYLAMICEGLDKLERALT